MAHAAASSQRVAGGRTRTGTDADEEADTSDVRVGLYMSNTVRRER